MRRTVSFVAGAATPPHAPAPTGANVRGGTHARSATDVLHFGDNFDILRRYLPDAAGDLVYLDPPFNSKRDGNAIFRDESGNAPDAQLLAFEDTQPLRCRPRGSRWVLPVSKEQAKENTP
jgi:hypothetical protein